MPDLATLRDLHRRLSEATGPDRELDAAIMAAFYTRDKRYIGAHWDDTGERYEDDVWVDPQTNKWVSTHAFEFTGSIDRALALIESALSGWSILLAISPDSAMANVHSHPLGVNGEWHKPGKGKTAPIALCLALVSALIAVEEGKGESDG